MSEEALTKQPEGKFCSSCGVAMKITEEICPKCGIRQKTETSDEWLTVLLLSIFLGALGVDRFYVGKAKSGAIKLLLSLCSFGFLAWVWWIIDIILIVSEKFTDAQGNVIKRSK